VKLSNKSLEGGEKFCAFLGLANPQNAKINSAKYGPKTTYNGKLRIACDTVAKLI
jgi:hypothetical protein